MKKIVFDSHGLCHRAMYTMDALTYETQHIGVIYGFLRQLLTFSKLFKSNELIFCWDSKSKDSLRKKLFPGYKEKRNKKELEPSELQLLKNGLKQFGIVRKEILTAIGFKNLYHQNGYEADDLIATTVMYHDEDFVCVTSDEDMYQLLDFMDMCKPNNKEIVTYESFVEKYRITPEQWIDVKAYGGCRSDGVPGIPGIGEGKAIQYILGKMNPDTKTYKKFTKEIYNEMKPLVELPFKGTKVFKIQKDSLSWDNFIDICDEYNFQSFLRDPLETRWRNCFNGVFELE